MSKNIFKIFTILIFIIVLLLIDISYVKIFNSYIYALFWLIILIVLILTIGFEKDKHINKKAIIEQVFIYCSLYLLITYFLGIFISFYKTGYNLLLISIIKTIFPITIIIILQELVRYSIVSKTNKEIVILTLLIIVFVLYDFLFGLRSYGINNLESLIKLFCIIILPSISKNILLTYLSIKGGYKPPIIYRFIMELTLYLLPIFPNFGDYLNSILNFIIPILLFLKFNKMYSQHKKRDNNKFKIISLIVIPTLLIFIVILNSGLFSFYSLSIGSWSMKPNLNVGDVIIIKKINNINNLHERDILVHNYNNIIYVHRIISIEKEDNNIRIQTKGDNNNNIDPYIVENSNIKGKVVFSIPLIGYPSVWLSKLFK